MSTDAGYGDLYMEVNRCEVVNEDSGYALFSDGGCLVVVNDSTVKAATHAMILAGRFKQKVSNSVINSGKVAAMAFASVGRLHVKAVRANQFVDLREI